MVILIKATKHNKIHAELLDVVGGVKCNAYLQLC